MMLSSHAVLFTVPDLLISFPAQESKFIKSASHSVTLTKVESVIFADHGVKDYDYTGFLFHYLVNCRSGPLSQHAMEHDRPESL